MPAAAQAAVLRTLQDGEVHPVGATHPVRVDVRVVSATHRDLEARVAHGSFREDLLARLSGFTFRLPPLRERREDIGLLVSVLLRSVSATRGAAPALSPEAGMALLRYRWPRNVRELEKCLARAVAVAGDGRIEVEHLAEDVRDGGVRAGGSSDDELRERLFALVRESRGNVTFAAKVMGTSRSQVHRWMKRFGIEARSFRR
jgi:transcriptional regulator of acetoin/glycerol metabolism